MSNKIFPKNADVSNGSDNIAIQIFGNRIFSDQSLYEYIIEFFLVFVSPKKADKESGKMAFHYDTEGKLTYYAKPRMGLKRFIFYQRSKKDVKIPIDEKAYNQIIEILKSKIGDRNDDSQITGNAIEAIQDLLYGYAAVLKNRSWTAQALLPIAPELIFCEAMLNTKERIKLSKMADVDDKAVEMQFDYSRHNFMARGGEVYYLHILQALQEVSNAEKIRLQNLLRHLITANSTHFSNLANWINDTWINNQNIKPDELWVEKAIGYIPSTGYIDCGKDTISELTTFLSNEMHPITQIELLSKGIVFQIMRMMCARTNQYLGIKPSPWIIDLRSKKSGNTVMKISVDSYRRVEELFVNAVNKKSAEYIEQNDGEKKVCSPFEYLYKAKTHTLNMFKRLGKEMQCIIPLKGGYERFSLSEDLLKFLVVSIVKPQSKITFDMFLDELYKHFNIVIGPKQYKKCAGNIKLDTEHANAFAYNEIEFQNILKNIGFLRDLSDATAIVLNPYLEVELGD